MTLLRIAHLSDLHAAKDKTEALPIIAAALADLERAHADTPIDLVVFSGDLADTGQSLDYEAAHDRLIEPLLQKLNLGPERLALVPGNHDVDRKRIDRYQEGGLRAELTNSSKVAELIKDPSALGAATDRLDAWNEYHAMLTEDLDESEATALGRTRKLEINGIDVGIASLNSSWRSAGDDDKNHLVLGEDQYRQALEQIRSCDVRIAVMHHPLPWLADFDANTARAALEGARSIVLCGHEHLPDPTGEFSLRGSAIYSRAGCLYENPKSLNGFTCWM